MENVIITVILVLILALAVLYIYRAKKNGKKCIGCPHSASCTKCNCSSFDQKE